MKRGTPRHPKLLHLCELLKCSRREAVGTLEMLWHFTAEFAPRGDIGRYDDDRIEAALDWIPDRWHKKGALIRALIQSGWVDIDTASGEHQPGITPVSERYHRLIIHDWGDHADDYVRKRIHRAGDCFVGDREKVTGQRRTTAASMADNGSLPTPVPVPVPVPSGVPHTQESTPIQGETARASAPHDLNGHTSQRFEEFYAMWPRQVRHDAAKRIWNATVSIANEEAVFACVARFLKSDQASRGVIANPDKFLAEQAQDRWKGNWPANGQRRQKESVSEKARRAWAEKQNGRK